MLPDLFVNATRLHWDIAWKGQLRQGFGIRVAGMDAGLKSPHG